MSEPSIKRAVAFIDGQNLFHHAKSAFGYRFPNYDIRALVRAICQQQAWQATEVCFYTGVPDVRESAVWNQFWNNRLSSMGRQGIRIFSRPLKYRTKQIQLPDGSTYSYRHGEEKGIDVRIALDAIGKAVRNEYDVALIFSQDQDLSEVATDIRLIAEQQNRWIKAACAFPVSGTATNTRGINRTDWIRIDRALYDSCIDPRDYRF